MATFNLIRNSRVFMTTNVNGNGIVQEGTPCTANNSQELAVLDGFSFSQASTADTITISEAGTSPVRGQRSFNTALNPVEFSFSTYIRPRKPATLVTADESYLWNALFGDAALNAATSTITLSETGDDITVTGTAPRYTLTSSSAWATPTEATTKSATTMVAGEVFWMKGLVGANASDWNTPFKFVSKSDSAMVVDAITNPATALNTTNFTGATFAFVRTPWVAHAAVAADAAVGNVPYSQVDSAGSNLNQLLKFGLVFTVDNATYIVDNCALNQASIDFNLEGIAQVNWSGFGTALRKLTTNVTYSTDANPVLTGGMTGTITGKTDSANGKFITNKLSTIALTSKIGGVGGTSYNLALTGGNITINNNINYITPASLGVVNLPIGYFTGTRSITGNVTAYLRTGTNNTADLLAQILADSDTTSETKYKLDIDIGGSNNTNRVEVLINGASLQVPTVDAQAVMSTTINFTAQGTEALTANNTYDLENTNDIRVRYFGDTA
ncbi:MAG TPA: hypothetical protein V6C58_23465 [Allocoleopsis sp.]